MASRTALMLELTVSRMLGSPARASRGIGLFRVACDASGDKVADQAVTIEHGSSFAVGSCGTLVVRTDKPVAVTLTSGGNTLTLTVTDLLALTADLTNVSVAYNEVGGTGAATVTIIQA